ncbi:MAG: hypothetical protein ACLQBJ_18660 [Bryobacteraceae bacterium]
MFWRNLIRGVLVVVGLAPIIVVTYFALYRGLTKEALMLLVGAELATLLFSFGLVVLHAIVTDQIRIDSILNEQSGEASVSRFQLIIFTFTIALTFVYLTLCGTGQFPAIPKEVLILLGISATTYGVGKGLQLGLGGSSSSSQPPPTPGSGTAPQAPAPPSPPVGNAPGND